MAGDDENYSPATLVPTHIKGNTMQDSFNEWLAQNPPPLEKRSLASEKATRRVLWAIRIGGLVAFLIAAVSILAAPKSHAQVGSMIHVSVVWSGPTNCIETVEPSRQGYNLLRQNQCMASQSYTQDYYSRLGEYIGVDPIMGAADWISCVVQIDGVTSKVSFATAGDGNDVNCLQILVQRGVTSI